MPEQAGGSAAEAGYEVQNGVRNATGERFHEWADIRKNPHIEGEVDDSEVDKHRSEHPPPLTIQSERSVVGTPGKHALGSWGKEGDTLDGHHDEDKRVQDEERESDAGEAQFV